MTVFKTELPAPVYIDTPEKLTQALEDWGKETLLSVDTESNSLHAYQEQVCLIQFSTSQKDYLLDPFAVVDLSPLASIFSNPNIQTIFHAAEYDLICLKRDYGFTFVNLFDTMVAARILGWEKVGLGSLLEQHFDVKPNKKYQRSNWGMRPLEPEMLMYAQFDTHYLIRLREILLTELTKKNLIPLADEDFKRACHVNGKSPEPKQNLCWKISGAHELQPQQVAVLQELCVLREKIAEQLDRPVFKVIGNQAMLAIAEQAPRSRGQLGAIEGVSPWFMRRFGERVLKAIGKGSVAEPIVYQKRKRPSDEFLNRLDAVRNWRKVKARSLGIQSDVVLPKDLMHDIVNENPTSGSELSALMVSVPWRLAQYGEEILEVLYKNGSS
jgi:ribonuclease D